MAEIGLFQNRVSDTPVPEWNLDDEATSIVRRSLEKDGYQVVVIPTRRHAEIAEAHRATLLRNIDLDVMRQILQAAQPESAVDAFIVLAKSRGKDPCRPETTVLIQGIGICAGPRMQMSSAIPGGETVDIEGPYGNRMLAPFASFRMTLFRASDFEVLANRAAAIRRSNMLGLPEPASVPYQRIHAAAYKESFGQFTEEEKRAIRKVIIGLLETTVPETLKAMGLISQ